MNNAIIEKIDGLVVNGPVITTEKFVEDMQVLYPEPFLTMVLTMIYKEGLSFIRAMQVDDLMLSSESIFTLGYDIWNQCQTESNRIYAENPDITEEDQSTYMDNYILKVRREKYDTYFADLEPQGLVHFDETKAVPMDVAQDIMMKMLRNRDCLFYSDKGEIGTADISKQIERWEDLYYGILCR